MQSVTQNYIEGMNEQFIGSLIAEVDVLNVNVDKQKLATRISFTNMTYNYWADGPLFEVREIRTPEIASFELNHTKANGQYEIPSFPYDMLLGTVLSSTAPNASGEYPLTAESSFTIGIPYYSWDNPRTPITVFLGENTGSVRFEFTGSGSYTKTVKAVDGWITINDVPLGVSFTTLKVNILTLLKPQQRARAYRFFLGTALYISGNDLVSMEYSERNDCVAIELPSQSVTIAVSNLNGEYDSEKEYDNPTFTKHHTQFSPRVGQRLQGGLVEWISLGRYFLSDYTVNSTEIKFNAISALGLLNEYPHTNWGNLAPTSAWSRFWEIAGSETDPDAPETACERFAIESNFWVRGSALSIMCANAAPAMSVAQTMQVLTCWISGCLYTVRGDTGLFAGDILVDDRETESVREISNDIIFGKIEWSADTTINKIEVLAHTRTNNTTNATLNTDPNSYANYAYITATSPIATIPGGYEMRKAYSALVNTYGGEETEFPVTLYNMDTYSNLITVSDGNGETITIDNPMMSNNDGVSARDFAERLYEELKHNVMAQFAHRGFPELDCGDVIMVETSPTVYVKARVIENTLTINQGAVSGKTKVRRLS